jgi:DNA-binding NarL/FixJ family response regulator
MLDTVPADSLQCLVVDDHPVVRQGIRALLERELKHVKVTDAASPDAAREARGPDAPDVVVIDPRRNTGAAEELFASLKRDLGPSIVVFTSDAGARQLSEALRAGVKGFVRKDSPPEDLVRAVQAAITGEFYVDPALSSTIVLEDSEGVLTPRQREILQMLANGMQTDMVARELGLSTETVRTHTKRILAKLRADTRTQAVAIGIRTGLIE